MLGRLYSRLVLHLSLPYIQSLMIYIYVLLSLIIFHIVYHYRCNYLLYFRCVCIQSFIILSAWLVTTETVKQAYGKWLVYGEFNTLGFISRLQLAYKSKERYTLLHNFYSQTVEGHGKKTHVRFQCLLIRLSRIFGTISILLIKTGYVHSQQLSSIF